MRRSSSASATPEALEGGWTDVGAHRLWTWTSSSAPAASAPVVLVHGIVSSRYLLPTAEAVARRHPVVAVDLPGFGRSSRPPRPLDVSALADALAGALVAVGVQRAVLVAHSTGAQVAVDLAVCYPHLPAGLVLVGPTGDPTVGSVARLWGRWAANAPREPAGFNALVPGEVVAIGPLRMLASARSFVRDRFEAKLANVTAPSLVVRGEHDRIAPKAWAAQVSARLGAPTVEIIPAVAHTVVYSAPDRLAALVSGFVMRSSAQGPPGP